MIFLIFFFLLIKTRSNYRWGWARGWGRTLCKPDDSCPYGGACVCRRKAQLPLRFTERALLLLLLLLRILARRK